MIKINTKGGKKYEIGAYIANPHPDIYFTSIWFKELKSPNARTNPIDISLHSSDPKAALERIVETLEKKGITINVKDISKLFQVN